MSNRSNISMPQNAGRTGTRLPPTLEWAGGADGVLRLLDQTLLPMRVETCDCQTVEQVWEAIRVLRVRGAPAIGVAAAYGLCLGVRPFRDRPWGVFREKVREVGVYLCSARPTAVNLAWAVRRVRGVTERVGAGDPAAAWAAMLTEAHAIGREDADCCRRIGEVGAELIPDGGCVLTHCNAGALATIAYGTALAPMYVAHERGRRFRVYVDETRPLLQGARLTALELATAGIEATVICDSAAASVMRAGLVQVVLVGADRIAANGDTANKVGTYSVAVNARYHGVPFYVAAPLNTFDRSLATGAQIPIEERSEDEIRKGLGVSVVPAGVRCYNPAFDVTPGELLSGIVTEKGVVKPVTEAKIAEIFGHGS